MRLTWSKQNLCWDESTDAQISTAGIRDICWSGVVLGSSGNVVKSDIFTFMALFQAKHLPDPSKHYFHCSIVAIQYNQSFIIILDAAFTHKQKYTEVSMWVKRKRLFIIHLLYTMKVFIGCRICSRKARLQDMFMKKMHPVLVYFNWNSCSEVGQIIHNRLRWVLDKIYSTDVCGCREKLFIK